MKMPIVNYYNNVEERIEKVFDKVENDIPIEGDEMTIYCLGMARKGKETVQAICNGKVLDYTYGAVGNDWPEDFVFTAMCDMLDMNIKENPNGGRFEK